MSLACPSANDTTYNDFTITCLLDLQYSDLPSYPATTLEGCIDSCIAYVPDFDFQNGAACVAITYNPGNPNGDKCYRKFAIDQERTGSVAAGLVSAVKVGINGTTEGSTVESGALSVSPTATTAAPLATGTAGGVVTAPAGVTMTSVAATGASASSSSAAAAAASNTNGSDSNSSNGLSTGAAAGLGVGVAVGVLLVAGIILFVILARRKKARRQSGMTNSTGTTDGGISPLTLVAEKNAATAGTTHQRQRVGNGAAPQAQELSPETEWDGAVGKWVQTKNGRVVEMGGALTPDEQAERRMKDVQRNASGEGSGRDGGTLDTALTDLESAKKGGRRGTGGDVSPA